MRRTRGTCCWISLTFSSRRWSLSVRAVLGRSRGEADTEPTDSSILLGSTSHYLVQKSSVPVMVARRRLRRPLRSTNPEDLRRSPRVALASANIEKIASSKQEDDIVDATDDDDPKIAADKRRDSAASAA